MSIFSSVRNKKILPHSLYTMGQDRISCGTTQIDENSSAHFTAQPCSLALVTGALPVVCYSLSLSDALISPFTNPHTAAIPPSATLCKLIWKATPLNHRFIYLVMVIIALPFLLSTHFPQKKACVRLQDEYNSPASTQNRKRWSKESKKRM